MTYSKFFDPAGETTLSPAARPLRLGDRPPDRGYVYEDPDERIVLAVNVALATQRPLLIAGEPGTGKSSLAIDVSERLKWRYYAKTISSRTQARDLLWTFDTIGRLSDAHTGGVKHQGAYVEPGVLWWAFSAATARRRGLTEEQFAAAKVTEASYKTPFEESLGAVVLIDEIDKADPDVPNDLLEPLGAFRFKVIEGALDLAVRAQQAPLVIITTNGERDLPKAFLRRCISLELKIPGRPRLLSIAAAHFPKGDAALHALIADKFFDLRDAFPASPPGTAEFIDAIWAVNELKLTPGADDWDTRWKQIEEATLTKRRGA